MKSNVRKPTDAAPQKTPFEQARDSFVVRARPIQSDRFARVSDDVEGIAGKYGLSIDEAGAARSAAIRQLNGMGDTPMFNVLAVSHRQREGVRFRDLQADQQQSVFLQLYGRRGSAEELAAQQDSRVSSFLHARRNELRSSGENPGLLKTLNQWKDAQSGTSNFQTVAQMGIIAGSMAVPGVGGVLVQVGGNVALAGYNEAKGRDVDWNRVAASSAVSLATRTSNPLVRAGASAGATYAVTGDAGGAALAGVVAGATTGQSLGIQITGRAIVDKAVNQSTWSQVAKNTGISLTIAAAPSPATRSSLSMMAAVSSKDPMQVFSSAMATAREGRKPGFNEPYNHAPGEVLGSWQFDTEALTGKALSTVDLRGGQSLPVGTPRRPAPVQRAAAPVPTEPRYTAPVSRRPPSAQGVTRQGFQGYAAI